MGDELPVSRRVAWICALAMGLAAVASVVAQVLMWLIGFCTNLFYYGRISKDLVSPGGNHLGAWAVLVPVGGGLLVGLMARYGSKAIRGHGIPEAMEKILVDESRIPARVAVLKPLSSAVSIGSGGPFGAEGPIIATGGALGSLLGQVFPMSTSERKTLLAAGAAAGMSATFGSPVSAVLLAMELLLFEYRPRSLIPVALASAVAAGMRLTWVGAAPAFAMPEITNVPGTAVAYYIGIGVIMGLASVAVTKLVYWVEDAFEEHLPIHWMLWPAVGGVVVGLVGLVAPATLGVGYDNIEHILSGSLAGGTLIAFCTLKFVSWAVALGSGTSGGTLAPLFTVGGGIGAALGAGIAAVLPGAGVDPRVAGLVGMAAIFAGASRAWLASIVFAFETTRQPLGLLPLLGGCTASYLISNLLMRTSIMTEKIVRRGVHVPHEYVADELERNRVGDFASKEVVTLPAGASVAEIRRLVEASPRKYSHQGFPVLDADALLCGVVTRRDFMSDAVSGDAHIADLIRGPVIVAHSGHSLRRAADLMAIHHIGRLPVVSAYGERRVVGFITRSDILGAHARRLREG